MPPAGFGFTKVEGSYELGLALHSSGTVSAWGMESPDATVGLPADADNVDIASTLGTSHVLRTNGTIVSAGDWLGDQYGLISGTPAGSDFTSVVGGIRHMLALRTDGSIAAWGNDSGGEVSNAPGGTGFVQLAAGNGVSLALHSDGWISAWGVVDSPVVQDAPTGARFAAVGTSQGMAYAIRADAVGTPLCVGDGSDVACPCGNFGEANRGGGCRNSTGKGAELVSTGSASVAVDDLRFHVLQAPAWQTAVLVEGVTTIQVPFRDGVLCTGNPTERVEYFSMDGSGAGSSTVSIVTEGNVTGPGSNRNYQVWYRDPAVSVCGSGSNLTNALRVNWQ